MAALAQTSLDIDTLTIATLYNRGSPLSSGQAYVPVVSSFTFVDSLSKVAFSKWTNIAITDLYDSVFYNYSSGGPLLGYVSSIQAIQNLTSSSARFINTPISSYNSTSFSILGSLSTVGPSTISSLSNIYIYESSIVNSNYLSTNLFFSSIVPGVSTTINPPSTFYDKLFASTASSILTTGNYYYVPAEGPAIRFIGPGISSISSIFQDSPQYPFYANISSGFNYILSSISVGWSYSNSSLNI
jgi:hypothetical protein